MDLFKTMELLNKRYLFLFHWYAGEGAMPPPQTNPQICYNRRFRFDWEHGAFRSDWSDRCRSEKELNLAENVNKLRVPSVCECRRNYIKMCKKCQNCAKTIWRLQRVIVWLTLMASNDWLRWVRSSELHNERQPCHSVNKRRRCGFDEISENCPNRSQKIFRNNKKNPSRNCIS